MGTNEARTPDAAGCERCAALEARVAELEAALAAATSATPTTPTPAPAPDAMDAPRFG